MKYIDRLDRLSKFMIQYALRSFNFSVLKTEYGSRQIAFFTQNPVIQNFSLTWVQIYIALSVFNPKLFPLRYRPVFLPFI
jgi:hypothetical protein